MQKTVLGQFSGHGLWLDMLKAALACGANLHGQVPLPQTRQAGQDPLVKLRFSRE
jgi:hypothetical protein